MTTPLMVLVLEDDAADAVLIGHALRPLGAEVETITVSQRTDFLAACRTHSPGLIIADRIVDGLNHLEVLDRVQRQWPDAGFLLCSADVTCTVDRELRERGAIGALSKEQLAQLPMVARLALDRFALAQSNSTLDKKARQVAQHDAAMKTLVDAVLQLAQVRSLSDVQRIVATAARTLTGADGATLVMRDRDMCVYAEEDAVTTAFRGARFAMSECIGGWAMQHGIAAVVSDVLADERISAEPYANTYVRSLVMVPIRTDPPRGAIGNYWAHTHTPTEAEIDLIQALADCTAVAMSNIETQSQLEERVQARTRALEQANADLESFSYCVSHDLRAPLRHINGFTKLLQEQHAAALDSGGAYLLTRIAESTRHMGRLIDDFLQFARFGQQSPQLQMLDMRALAYAALEAANPDPSHPVRIVVGELPQARGDRQLIEQVWHNLISNAFKFTFRSSAPHLEIGAEASSTECIFWVQDNGVGFDATKSGRLFKVFQRLHAGSDYPGTGIGLALVEKIISRHGGRVWAHGVPNVGATFYFSLPLTR